VSVRRLSIFGTLVLWFTTAGFLILVAMSFFLFQTFERSQERDARDALSSRLQDVVTDIERSDDDVNEELARVRDTIERENATRPRSRFGVAVREGGRILLSIGDLPPEASFPSPAARPSMLPVVHALTSDERELLLTSAAVHRRGHRYVVDVALDETANRESLDDFRTNTCIGLFVAATLLALAGAIVARQAMRPLARITAVTHSLDVGRLDQRLEGTTWPAELRALATEFGRMQARLRESFERLAQFSDDLAHELRTPVNNLLGTAEVAVGHPRSADEYRDTIVSMLEETQRLRRMIDELLFLARADHPEQSLERGTLDARAETAGVIDFFSALADEKRVTMSIEGTGTVDADRPLLRRALGNLVANALQYTAAGDSVRIVIQSSPDATTIAVRDNGSGIEPRHLPRLFDRFYRADEARSGHAESTGLGLAIVRSIVGLHGGTVEVESEPGRGSTFVMRFPKMTKL
jgi:two-component system heavy metal sensor histidine kinase CusS